MKDFLSTITIKGMIAIIIIVGGLYILAFNNSTADIKIATVGLMSSVIGYYFGSSSASGKKDETIANIATGSQIDEPQIK